VVGFASSATTSAIVNVCVLPTNLTVGSIMLGQTVIAVNNNETVGLSVTGSATTSAVVTLSATAPFNIVAGGLLLGQTVNSVGGSLVTLAANANAAIATSTPENYTYGTVALTVASSSTTSNTAITGSAPATVIVGSTFLGSTVTAIAADSLTVTVAASGSVTSSALVTLTANAPSTLVSGSVLLGAAVLSSSTTSNIVTLVANANAAVTTSTAETYTDSTITLSGNANQTILSATLANDTYGTVTLAANATLALSSSNAIYTDPSISGNTSSQYELTSTGVISGTGSLTKTGAGVLFLNGVNTFTAPAYPTGGIFLDGGLISIQQDSNLGNVANILRFNGGGLQVGAESAAVTIGSGLTSVNGLQTLISTRQMLLESVSGTIDVLNGTTFLVDGPISGNANVGLIKNNPGTLQLNGILTFAGPVTVNDGTLKLGGLSSLTGGLSTLAQLPSGQALNVNNVGAAAGTFDMSGLSLSAASLSGTGTGQIINSGSSTTTLTLAEATGTSYGGLINGNIALVKNGLGTLNLSNNGSTFAITADSGTYIPGTSTTTSSYSGGTTINAGLIEIPNFSAFGTGTLTFAGGGLLFNTDTTANISKTSSQALTLGGGSTTLAAVSGLTETLSGVIGGSGQNLIIGASSGTGTIALTGLNTYTGATSITNGATVSINTIGTQGVSSSLGAYGVGNGTISLNGTLIYTGSGNSTDRLINLTAGSGSTSTITANGTGTLTLAPSTGNAIDAVGFTGTNLVLNGTGNGTINATSGIGIGPNIANLTVNGSGTWTNSNGANTYTGTTTVSNGATYIGTAGTTAGSGAFGNSSTPQAINITGGTLQLNGIAGSTTTTAAALTPTNGSTLAINAAGGASTTLALSSLVGSATAGNTLTVVPVTSTTGIGSGNEFITFGTTPALTNGIVSPWVIGQQSATNTSGDFLMTSGGNNTLSTFNGYVEGLDSVTSPNNVASETQYSLGIGGTTTITVYALKVTGQNIDFTNSTNSVLNITSGGLIMNSSGLTPAQILSPNGTVAFGLAPAFVFAGGASGSTISSLLTGSGGFTKFGPAMLTLSGTNTFTTTSAGLTGLDYLNGGILAISADANLGGINSSVPVGSLTTSPSVFVTPTFTLPTLLNQPTGVAANSVTTVMLGSLVTGVVTGGTNTLGTISNPVGLNSASTSASVTLGGAAPTSLVIGSQLLGTTVTAVASSTSSLNVSNSALTSTLVTLQAAAPANLLIGSSLLGSTVTAFSGNLVTLAATANAAISSATAENYTFASITLAANANAANSDSPSVPYNYTLQGVSSVTSSPTVTMGAAPVSMVIGSVFLGSAVVGITPTTTSVSVTGSATTSNTVTLAANAPGNLLIGSSLLGQTVTGVSTSSASVTLSGNATTAVATSTSENYTYASILLAANATTPLTDATNQSYTFDIITLAGNASNALTDASAGYVSAPWVSFNGGTLQIGATASLQQTTSTGGTATSARNFLLNGQGGTINVATGITGTVTGAIAGSGPLIVNNGTNGTTGILSLTPALQLVTTLTSGSSVVTVTSTADLAVGAVVTATGLTTGTTIGAILSPTTFVASNAATSSVTETGTYAVNNFSGGVTIEGGTLEVAANNALGAANSLNPDLGTNVTLAGGKLLYNPAATAAFNTNIILGAGTNIIDDTATAQPWLSGVISGSGALTLNGTGSQALTILGNNTYTGGTTISGAAAAIAADSNTAFGTGTLTFTNGTGARLMANGFLTTLANNVAVTGNFAFNSSTLLQSLVFSGGTWGLSTAAQPALTTTAGGVAEVVIADNIVGASGNVTVSSASTTSNVVTLSGSVPSGLIPGASLLGSTVVSVSGTTVTLAGNASLTISSLSSEPYAVGTLGFSKLGGNTSGTLGFVQENLILDNSANSYFGGTLVNQGTVWARNGTLGANVSGNNVTITPTLATTPTGLRLSSAANLGSNQQIVVNTTGGVASTANLPIVAVGYNGFSALLAEFASSDTQGILALDGVQSSTTINQAGNQTFTTPISEAGLTTAGNWLLGATADNATYAPTSAMTAGAGSDYRLDGGGGVLTISDANVADVLTGTNGLIIGGNNGANAVVGTTGTVLINSVQNFTGGVTIDNGGTLTVTLNGALGNAANGVTLTGGTLDLREASTIFSNTDSQYSGRNITFNASSTITADHFNGGLFGNLSLGTLTSSTSGLTLTATLNDDTNLTFTGGVSLGGGTTTISVANANTAVVFGAAVGQAVSGSGLTKIGSGALVLTIAGTYSGPTTVTAGDLIVTGPSVMSPNTTLGTLLNGGVLDLRADNGGVSNGSVTYTLGTGTPTVSASSTINVNRLDNSGGTSDTIILPSLNMGAGSAVTLTVTGNANADASGVLAPTIPGGTVTYTADDRLEISGVTALQDNATFSPTTASLYLDGKVVGFGVNLAKTGAGALFLMNTANTYSGTTTVTTGSLVFESVATVNGGASSLGSVSTIANGTISLGGGTLFYIGSGSLTDRLLALTAASSINASGTGALNFVNSISTSVTVTGASLSTNLATLSATAPANLIVGSQFLGSTVTAITGTGASTTITLAANSNGNTGAQNFVNGNATATLGNSATNSNSVYATA